MNHLFRTLLFTTIVTVLVGSTSAQNSARVFTPEVQVSTRIVGSPSVSPNRRFVVYTINEPLMTADKSEFVTQIWLGSTDGKENRQITFGEKNSTNPKWSPDGSMIAFTSNRKDNRNYIYVLRLSGGEAEQITDVKSSVSNFEWSPDGEVIAFTMSDAKTDDEEKNDKGRNDFRWVDENQKFAGLYVTPVAKDAAGKREVKRLAANGRQVTSFSWAPNGSKIAFAHVAFSGADHWPTSDVSVVDLDNGRVTVLAGTAAAEQSPRFSPDGKWISMTVSDMPARWAQSSRIAIYPAGGGQPRTMPLSHDGQPNMIDWTPDNAKIMFFEPKGTGTSLYEVNVAAGTIREVDHQGAVINGVSMASSGNVGALVMQRADLAPEVYTVGDDGFIQISNANAAMKGIPMSRTEVIKWKSRDGREIEGLLHYPAGYQAVTKVPMILNIHGGPAGVFQQTFIGGRGSYPLASFAAKGFAVLRPNPRGSSGYGTEFRRANIRDWGGMDYEDLMMGVDHVIGMGVADPERLGVMGWSYGGYMTSMIITKTDRFKAASAGAPVTNLMSFNGTADIPSFVPDYFESEFWDDPDVYAKHSAMFHIKNAKTPTLIQHGENDIRVPIAQGYELYNALRRRGVPTRMIVLPRQPHGIQEPKLQIATMQSNLDWFEKYLK